MNSKIRTLMIAVPLATAALTIGTPGLAMASDQPGPVIVMPVEGDPKPMDIAVPTPTPEPQPEVPDDKAPVPQDDEPAPQDPPIGPDDVTDVPDCTHGCDGEDVPDDKDGPNDGEEPGDFPLDQGCFEGCDLPEDPQDVDPEVKSIAIPTRVDAGLADGSTGAGAELSWLIAGVGLVTASGAAYAARTRTRSRA